MSRPDTLDPNCTICRGRGWFETFLYDVDDIQPCPHCNPVQPIPLYVWWTIYGGIVLALIAIVWGSR